LITNEKDRKRIKERISEMSEIDKTSVKKIKMDEDKNDYAYWRMQSYGKRLAALEAIRSDYIKWKYGNQQRLQRILKVVKQE